MPPALFLTLLATWLPFPPTTTRFDDAIKTVVGHVVPIGARRDDSGKVTTADWERCRVHQDGLLLEAANDEVFLLHGLDTSQRAFASSHANQPLAVDGVFRWQGKLRTLAVQSLRVVDREAHAAARSTEPEYEMHAYVLVLIQPGPNANAFDAERRKELSAGHFAHIAEQAKRGKLVIAGPFGPHDPKRFSGLYVYRCRTVEEAEALNHQDPSIASGYFQTISIPWFGPKSLGY